MCPRDPDTNQVFDCGDNGHCWMQQCCCNLGYEGDNCETDIRECESNPCGEGATCVDEINFYICFCPPGRLHVPPCVTSCSVWRVIVVVCHV